MAILGKITPKRVYQTSDGMKFDSLEEAQHHSEILKFRERIGVYKYLKNKDEKEEQDYQE